jgi:FtsP/CotA-like multicopper oxidase with cupredoxin domain
MKRREFLQAGGAVGAAGIVGTAVPSFAAEKSEVATEMERRLKYLKPPQGSPPDLIAHPSPPVTPFQDYSLSEFRPPLAEPLFRMTGAVLASECDGCPPNTEIQDLSNDDWWKVFESRFAAARKELSDHGFATSGDPWPVRQDRVVDGHIKIDIGDLPRPNRHQQFWDLRPHAFYINREVEFRWRYHPQYGEGSWTWGYHYIAGRDQGGNRVFEASRPCSPGPTFHARYGAPILTRRLNDLPEIGNGEGHSKLKFAYPSTTSHLHNAHTASESDGFPSDWLNPGEYWDHHYGNFPSGHDDREKLSTLWYHDHRMDFTASNVYAGLDGFYLLFDEKEDENSEPSEKGDRNDETKGWRLPSGDYDIPLIFHDLAFAQEKPVLDQNGKVVKMAARSFSKVKTTRWTFDSPQDWDDSTGERGRWLANGERKAIRFKGSSEDYAPAPELVFDGFNTDGIIGDRWTVNRRIQPKLKVESRKYRLRLLNGGPSRFYDLYLHADEKNVTSNMESKKEENPYGLGLKSYQWGMPKAAVYGYTGEDDYPEKPTSELERPFIVICGDGNFQPNPVLAHSIYLGVAQRVDVIIDFSRFEPGTLVYLVNRLEQANGRGPTERFIDPGDYDTDEDFYKANAFIAFEVKASASGSAKTSDGEAALEGEPVADNSAFPMLFREFPPIDFTEVKRERLWEFDYDGGLWTINGRIFDPNRIDAGIEQDSAEIWTFRNAGNGWHHPIHSHFTEFLIIERNNMPFSQGSIQAELVTQGGGGSDVGGSFASRGALAKTFGFEYRGEYKKQPKDKYVTIEEGMVRATEVLRSSMNKRAPQAASRINEVEARFNAVDTASAEPRNKCDGEGEVREIGPIMRIRRALENLGIGGDVLTAILDDVSAVFGLRALREQVRQARDACKVACIGRKVVLPTERAIDAATDLLIKWHPNPMNRAKAVEQIRNGEFDKPTFQSYAEFVDWANVMPCLGLGEPVVDRFMGGARRDVAVLLPNTEVTVFARWKDFLGKHVMHCHNVVHEDHAMMIRWDIVPKNQGFDRPRHVDEVAKIGERVDVRPAEERREHIESHPKGSAIQPDDH